MNIKAIINKVELKYPFVTDWISHLKLFTLPGFEQMAVYDVLQFLISEISKDQISTRARSISYSFFIAFFPGIIFLFTLLPYIPLEGIQESLIAIISDIIPKNVIQNFILVTIDDVLNKPRVGLLSFASLLTLYFSTQGMASIINSFNKSYSIYKRRNFLKKRWLSFQLTFLLFIMFIFSMILLVLGSELLSIILDWFKIKNVAAVFALNLIRYLVILLLYFLSISSIYYYGPAVQKKFKFVSLGSSLATIVSIVASIIFSFYITDVDKYNYIYGFFGSIIMFLGWLYINSYVLLLGFELNASIYYHRNLKHNLEEQ